jgi:hypothetical protein
MELIAYFVHPYYCKTDCTLRIYSQKGIGGTQIDQVILDTKSPAKVGVMGSVTNGWHDIILGDKTWRWNGSQYETE